MKATRDQLVTLPRRASATTTSWQQHGISPLVLKSDSLFIDPGADTIIRSSDNVDFRVYKLLLSLASPVFRDMFSSPEGEPNSREVKDGIRVFNLTENSHTLHKLLGLCYPKWNTESSMGSLDDIESVLLAASKYKMEEVRTYITTIMVSYRESDPLRLFAIACRFKLEQVARTAAKGTLRIAPLGRPCVKGYQHITAASLHYLLHYHFKCVLAAKSAVDRKTPTYPVTSTPSSSPILGKPSPQTPSCSCKKVVFGRKDITFWWLSSYLTAVRSSLDNHPHPSSATDTRLVEHTIKEAQPCAVCGPNARKDMIEYSELLSSDIGKEVDKVILELSL